MSASSASRHHDALQCWRQDAERGPARPGSRPKRSLPSGNPRADPVSFEVEVPMAVSIDGGGGDRKKPLTAELNLVPYIDLLTCMVAFLLITAVWTQLASLPIGQKGTGSNDEGL